MRAVILKKMLKIKVMVLYWCHCLLETALLQQTYMFHRSCPVLTVTFAIHVHSLQDLKAVHVMSIEHGDHSIRAAARYMESIMAVAAGSEIKVRFVRNKHDNPSVAQFSAARTVALRRFVLGELLDASGTPDLCAVLTTTVTSVKHAKLRWRWHCVSLHILTGPLQTYGVSEVSRAYLQISTCVVVPVW